MSHSRSMLLVRILTGGRVVETGVKALRGVRGG